MKRLSVLFALWVGVFGVCAQDNVVISEFMASNDGTLADEDGDFEDWIEIYNAGANTVNLFNWQLGDRNNLWAFPATNLPPNSFMVIFASNKNRKIPGRPLHTSFRLDANPPERVRLLRPDNSVASDYNLPPIQVTDYSYGIPLTQTPISLVATGANARMLVPLNDSLAATWTLPEFNDTTWTPVNNGVGFENDAPGSGVATVLANSITEFSDTQGLNNWVYGYWDKRNDANGTYAATEFVSFPRGTGNTLASTNYWNGTTWNWPPPADPPWTELNASGGHPAGANGSPTDAIHWVVRRYISETNGLVRLSGILACSSQSGACGDGTIGRIYVDGVEVFQRAVRGESHGYAIQVNVSLGSFIDLVIDPGAADNDFCDTTTFTAVVRTAADTALVADTIADWSDTGAQGYKGWTYGAFIKTNTSVIYSVARFGAFPSGTGPHGANNFWNGEQYQWFDGDPPFDRVGQLTCQPNIFPSTSTTNAQEHWVVRRWVSEIAGTLHVDWHLGKQDLLGGGATAKLFRNGTQVGAMTIGGGDFAGSNRTDMINNVQVGDVIDFTVEPGADIVGDICFFNATIHGFSTLANQFRTDVGGTMNANATAYLRIPFNVSDAAAIRTLTLRLKYDDGVVAYLNGNLVANRNAPEPALWNSAAIGSRIDADASQFEDFDLTAAVVDLLRTGNNVLAIQGLNSSISDLDFLIVAELNGGLATLNTNNANYFAAPTPGSANGVGAANVGPIVTDITHTPHDPADDEDLVVTARVLPVLNPIAANGVRLYYRVQFGAEVNVVMLDDGLHQDGVAGDGIFGATIPHTASGIGQMVRYYVTATDGLAGLTRQPTFPHPLFSSQYFGAVVKNPALTNPLEVLHMFITDANLNSANTLQDGRFPCSVYFLGEFYDNMAINRHGQSSQGFPKKSYDMDFNGDHTFRWNVNERRVDDINLLSTYPDKSHMRNILGYGVLRDAGAAHHFVIPVRVQTNGGFFGDWHMMENGDDRYLERIGKDPKGALYKMYNTFDTVAHYTIASGQAEKKTRREEGNADLQALFNGVNVGTLQVKTNYMYDNINIAATINAFAGRTVTSEHDCCHKNYYFYRDSDGSGEWEGMAWDMDLSFGRNWQSGETYYDDRVYTQNRIWGNWDNNRFFQLVFNQGAGLGTDATRQMYIRRVRTLMEEQQQTNGTPAALLHFERVADEYAAMIGPDAAMDLVKWGTWGGGATGIFATNSPFWRSLSNSVAELKTNYMVGRRNWVFTQNMGLSGADLISWTNRVPTNVTILIDTIDYNPSSGNQNEEYIRLVNTNQTAVDISHWTLSGAIEHTFQGGVVLPRNGGSVYVVPNKKAFRARATAPRGGMGLYVEGPYQGQLSARGESIILSHKLGHVIRTNLYLGNPTPAQNGLRVTEIMYHPTALPSDLFPVEEYEYIELRNIGVTTLDLNGVRFANGLEFTFGAMTLAPGAYVLVVKNIAAFESRYGPGFNIAGQYIGSLDNGGENLQIDDAAGEKVQDFSFNNSWYPITDGAGASLVIVNDAAHWDSWGLKESWRPSTYDGGTPAAGDTPALVVAPVLVNEVLTHTDLPMVDMIELRNTNTVAADISGWFISDDFEEPKKFRIPDGTIIAPDGYIVFDESHFNPSGLGFSFSSTDDEAYLFSGDGTRLTGYFHGFGYGPAENGVSFARHVDSVTNEHFVASSANTFNGANAYPKVGPIVISEIMYHPAVDNSLEEFIELHNLSGSTVELFDDGAPANTWRVRGGVSFDFPTNHTLASGAFAIVASFNPTNTALLEQFRARYNLSPAIAVYGPYDGQLNNAGDSVLLLKPDETNNDETSYVLVDGIDYLDLQPWPLAADGIGASLQRKVLPDFGNDPANWAGGLSPGGNYGGTPPTITSQSGSQTTVAGRTLTLNATVTGSEPMYYQWRHNSNNLPGAATSALIIPNLQPEHAGTYNLVVYNSAGSAESTNIQVVIQLPPRIVGQPVSQAVIPNVNVTFTVGATSVNTNILQYQWHFNGVEISGATSNSYTVVGAQLANDGFYSVLVTDPVDSVLSVPARLTILIQPFIVQHPISQFVPQGGSATLSVSVTNTATLPVTNRWRRVSGASGGPATNVVFGYTDFFTVTNVQGSNRYDVIVYNQGRPLGFQSLTAFIVAIPDTDADGLPDTWETENGIDDANADADGDTMNNLAEYIAGTNPQDGQSYLKVERLSLSAGANIEFMALSNKTYTVEASDVLGSMNWNRIGDVYATSNSGPATVRDTNSTSARFYRLTTPRKR